jgi:hypothetical protein
MEIVDLRFVDIGYERMMLQRYAELIGAHLTTIQENEIQRIWESTDRSDEADVSNADHFEEKIRSGITTRFLTAAVVIATWALYESSVEEIAEYGKNARGLRLRISAIRGTFLERARTYFDEVLRFPLHDPSVDWQRLEDLAYLRNFLAHGNGDTRNLVPNRRNEFDKWLGRTSGVAVVDDYYLVTSPQFVKDVLIFMNWLLDDLTTRAAAEFPA